MDGMEVLEELEDVEEERESEEYLMLRIMLDGSNNIW